MPDEQAPAPAPAATPSAAPKGAPSHAETDGPLHLHVTVSDYCLRKLGQVGMPEMLNAFHRAETTGGVVKDSVENFDKRFAAFGDLPA